jgi:hypothetical protein
VRARVNHPLVFPEPSATISSMSTPRRAFLLALAIALVVVVFSMGTSFTFSAESPERARGSAVFWLLPAVAFASPLWIPAVLPARWRRASVAVQWLSAAALLVPLRYAGAVTFHQFQLYPLPLFSIAIFGVAAMLGAGCIAAIAVLLLPSFHRVVGKAT